jgi:hypothetical protein
MKDFLEDIENEKTTWLDKISLWWRFEGQFILTDIKIGVRKVIYWLPIIWKDRDYSHTCIYDVLKHKLKSQSKYIGDRDRHTRAKYDSQRIQLCVNLIEKLQDDYYNHEYMDYAKYRYWFEECKDKPGYSTWESETIWEKYDEFFEKHPSAYRRVMNGEGFTSLEGREDDKKVIAISIGHLNHDRARKLLFEIMSRNIEGWWD